MRIRRNSDSETLIIRTTKLTGGERGKNVIDQETSNEASDIENRTASHVGLSALLGRVCPCCRSKPTRFLEQWNCCRGEIPFNLVHGVLVAEVHDPPEPDPAGVIAECSCGHKWKLRGIRQITNFGIRHVTEI